MALVGFIAFLGACALTDAQRPWCDLIVAAIPDFTVEVPRLGAAFDRTAVPPHARRAKVVGQTASREEQRVVGIARSARMPRPPNRYRTDTNPLRVAIDAFEFARLEHETAIARLCDVAGLLL